MACSVPHNGDEIQALVQKLIDEDIVRQKAILNLALQFKNAYTAKDDLRKAYEKCNDIPQERRALIDTFLKDRSDKDYELNLSMYGKAAKIEKQLNDKLVWLLEKYNYHSQTSISGSSSQSREIRDVYLTKKELHQLHLDEKSLREILEEEARDEKEREQKIRQKQADDEEFFLEFEVVKYDSEYEIIPDPAGIVQAAKLLQQRVILLGLDGAVMSTQEYMKKVVKDVGDDEDFKSGSWVSATDYVNANGGTKVVKDVGDDEDFKSGSWVSATDYVNANGGTVSGCLGDIKNNLKNRKLDQVVAIVKSCSPNVLGDLTVIIKDLSGTIPGTIHHKVIGKDGYGKDITVGAVLILANVSVFSPKPSMHYLNITKINMVKATFTGRDIVSVTSGEPKLTSDAPKNLTMLAYGDDSFMSSGIFDITLFSNILFDFLDVEALVQKLIDEDKGRQNAILDLVLQFKNSCTAKYDLINAYEKCTDISQESRALIDTFLKEGSDKDYELNLYVYGKVAKLEKQIDAKLAWLLEKYYCRSQTHIGDVYLNADELHQLHLDEEALK
uniref:Homologous recombination OB-fold protein OB-fold domain-containing protein n=1 Tax=Tanacetum cinerariifolium TaxID=118510 RepID=A0A6L2JZF9_TANCI|nr:hypothetical protein [Tanacetum cinerariifolium]